MLEAEPEGGEGLGGEDLGFWGVMGVSLEFLNGEMDEI